MQRRVILFENIVSEVLGKHGNKWNSKRYIDVVLMRESLEYGTHEFKGIYESTGEEIEETATYLYGKGIEKPCIVAVRENEDDKWRIMWYHRKDFFRVGEPVLFNVCFVDRNGQDWELDVIRCHEYIKEGELMLSWTHLWSDGEYASDYSGHYAIYKSYPLGDSIFCDTNPLPAKTVTFGQMLEILGLKKLTLDAIRSFPVVIEKDLENGYGLFEPNQKKPCFLMIGGKILCNNKSVTRLPYLYNAEGYAIDSYVRQKGDDEAIREYEWDTDGGIGVRFKKDNIEDWR